MVFAAGTYIISSFVAHAAPCMDAALVLEFVLPSERSLQVPGMLVNMLSQTALHNWQLHSHRGTFPQNVRLTSCTRALLYCAACRTDFDCCDDSHGDYKPHHTQLGDTIVKAKAAGCDWNIDLLREYDDDGNFDLYPVKEGPYLKYGTVTGKCEQHTALHIAGMFNVTIPAWPVAGAAPYACAAVVCLQPAVD
jgi:hypothetical protein